MATRFYPDPTNAPSVSPAYDGDWNDTTQAVRRKLELGTAGNNGSVARSYTDTSATTPYYALLWQFVTEPLNSQILQATGTRKLQALCYEDSAKVNGNLAFILRVCDGDGSNATKYGYNFVGLGTTEFDENGYVNRTGSSEGITIAFDQGKRLILEVGVQFTNAKTDPYIGYVKVTDNHASTDLPQNETETTEYNSWFQCGGTFAEASGGAVAPTSVLYGPLCGPFAGPI